MELNSEGYNVDTDTYYPGTWDMVSGSHGVQLSWENVPSELSEATFIKIPSGESVADSVTLHSDTMLMKQNYTSKGSHGIDMYVSGDYSVTVSETINTVNN